MSSLVEIDSLEALIIVDNELDIMSKLPPDTLTATKTFGDLVLGTPHEVHGRGHVKKEVRLDSICCAAHGLSILLTATKGDIKHSVLFDTGPEEDVWERNVKRLGPDLSKVEAIHLSHWHRDHSGGMLRAIKLIKSAQQASNKTHPLTVDLHPSRPDFRGVNIDGVYTSLEADPSFSEIEGAGAIVSKNAQTHTILDDMFLVSGEIPRVTEYETGLRFGIRYSEETGKWTEDRLIMDERFLMCNLKGKGLVMFTGCSHAGAVNASLHAAQVGAPAPLYAVVGGYHLVPGDEEQIRATVKDFKKLDVKMFVPGHCSGWRVKFEIEKEMPGRLVPCSVGLNYIF